MRLFQNSGISPSYRQRLKAIYQGTEGFQNRKRAFLQDGYVTCHFLLPIMEDWPDSFFTNGDDADLQQAWAKERGLSPSANLTTILLAQIEDHRAEVFYNLDPIRYGGEFIKKLPGCVKHTLCWRAAPSQGLNLAGFDLLICNFPSILKSYSDAGLRAAYFAPAHDPMMDRYAGNQDRPIDILFVGGYSRHHKTRAKVLESVAELSKRYQVTFALDRSRLTRLAESPLGWALPLGAHRQPRVIRKVSTNPVFGRDLYELISKAKIVLNGAVDMAGEDRGNMRCFEALGCGALLVSDEGHYPEGFTSGENMVTYHGPEGAVARLEECLSQWSRGSAIAQAGCMMIRERYSKAGQWELFQALVASI